MIFMCFAKQLFKTELSIVDLINCIVAIFWLKHLSLLMKFTDICIFVQLCLRIFVERLLLYMLTLLLLVYY